MRRLDRAGVEPPADWDGRIARNLPDKDAFFAKATEHEALDVNDPLRRKGFAAFAPEVLKPGRKDQGFPPLWGKAKGHLARMSRHKCAYCESPINAERSGEVDHFRPKSLFPSLCYDWGNYFLACGGCNGQKSDKWPETGGYVRPDEGEPEARFRFSRDGGITAAPGDIEAENTIRDLGLDRSLLCRWRRLAIAMLLDDIEDALSLLRERPDLEDSVSRLVHRQTARIADNPGLPYSTAMLQCLHRPLPR